jgi:hypothetical protein
MLRLLHIVHLRVRTYVYNAYVIPLRYLSLNQYFECLFEDTVPVPFLLYSVYSYIPLALVSKHLSGPIFKFSHIQFDIHVTYLLPHFIFCITALSVIMSEWGITVMPFKIFENIVFKVLVLFRSSRIRNTDHYSLIL